jgi:transmembrane sensor
MYEEAAEWLVRHRDGPLEAMDKKAFDAWLRISPEHIRAYLEISAVWEDVSSVELGFGSSAAELIERAKGAAPVVPLSERQGPVAERGSRLAAGKHPSTKGATRTSPAVWHRVRFAATIATLCVAAGLISWWVRGPDYSTGIGEQRSITLADGSMVELNAQSNIRVRFVRHERDIDLVRGQALFHVAKDATRPFIVRAGDTVVRAVGTQFDVNELRGGTIVTVVEGLVAVLGTQAPGSMSLNANETSSRRQVTDALLKGLRGNMRPIFLSSGEQLTITAAHLAETAHVNLATVTAWTQHRFMFDAAPLSEVVEEFNRYNVRQLVIASPELDEFRINGFFSSTDPSLLLQFLRNQPEIVVDDSGAEIRISKK